MISVTEAKRGQYLIPDANLTFEASSPRCLEALKRLGVDGKPKLKTRHAEL